MVSKGAKAGAKAAAAAQEVDWDAPVAQEGEGARLFGNPDGSDSTMNPVALVRSFMRTLADDPVTMYSWIAVVWHFGVTVW